MGEVSDRLSAALADRYAIERSVGAGGMATVYLGHDVRHDRNVALKVLRPELAAVVGAERFLAEIRTTANLQHPHILPLFDSGQADSFLFYVMPYVDGESLRERLDRDRQLRVEEAVRIATGVAAALEYAHERGVIHRDIKPANILLSRGEALVADFGIALAVSHADGGRFTETGLSLGTPHYMSPEQATGERTVDARTDVYALGCVLYEMLAGEPPYAGANAQAVLSRILTEEPKRVRETRRAVPLNVDAVVAKALEKLPADRFENATAFLNALKDSAFRHEREGLSAGERATALPSFLVGRGWKAVWATSVALAILVTALLMGWPGAGEAGPVSGPVRFTHVLPDGEDFTNTGRSVVAVAPDGSKVIFAANQQLYVRAVGEIDAEPIPGTQENPSTPFFSPDGEWIGYYAATQLKKISIRGGAPVVLTAAVNPLGASWGEDGKILYGQPEGIRRVSENGGPSELLIAKSEENLMYGPQLLPDGEHVLFTFATYGTWDEASVVVQSVTSGERRVLLGGSDARYVRDGFLVYAVGNTLMAVRFDLGSLEITGGQVPVASQVRRSDNLSTGTAHYGFSSNGVMAYVVGTVGPPTERELVWVDRSGRTEPLANLPRRAYENPRISPDGTRVLTVIDSNVWIFDIARGAGRVLTQDGVSRNASWSPDGTAVTYQSYRSDGVESVFVQPSDGSGPARRVTSSEPTHVDSWSPDGRALLIHRHKENNEIDILAQPIGEEAGDPVTLLGEENQQAAVVSPDGKWLAYVSAESGQNEIYVTPYPGPGGRTPVSAGGGIEPAWGGNGELFYKSLGDRRRLMAVEVSSGNPLRLGAPRELFEGRWAQSATSAFRANYDVSPDGQRFVMVATAVVDSSAVPARPRFNVTLNWFDELRALVPRD